MLGTMLVTFFAFLTALMQLVTFENFRKDREVSNGLFRFTVTLTFVCILIYLLSCIHALILAHTEHRTKIEALNEFEQTVVLPQIG